ncbi:kinesin-domain-containing protein [Calocera cornea HHB12733]|uniref:Kinesin-like protein n=1 Tax=Calocera cornea HHB12733 TaxID=1353952 RepID=A0A165IWM3_9BASI|nr:kinesin-domain-containing protein [Calocera cornea HHB12733]
MVNPPKTPSTRASNRSKAPATAPAPARSRKLQDLSQPPTTPHRRQMGHGAPDVAAQSKMPNILGLPANGVLDGDGAEQRLGEEDREPLKAYLRIRAAPENPTHTPYLTVQSGTTVLTNPPLQSLRLTRPATSYTFNSVFPPSTSQATFFSQVALPLVQDLMAGENGLLFAYGVSGAGKTWTIQGGRKEEERGLVWRVLKSVMSSVKGLQGDVPVRIAGKAVIADEGARDSLGSGLDSEDSVEGAVKVDRNYTYSVFVSYAEIYNERVFDLLAPTATSSSKRKALALKSDPCGGGKYIQGLKEVRVRTTREAHDAFAMGLLARQVSGTKVNHHSSRSHAIFSVRVVRVHRGRPADPNSIYSSRLSIVDLAGSERSKATLATGDRLKESGSINKSLMVLGQCMEVLRLNQRKLALAGCHGGGPIKLGVVPFRHSKMTELFQDFFVGDGRAVMVVNVNPYDGGFDEIVNVMRFSALASQVKTGHSHLSGLAALAQNDDIPRMIPEETDDLSAMSTEVEGDEAEPEDPLVTHLFEQLEDMRQKLYEAEMRCALIESETREEVTREMEGRMRAMERMFSERIMFDAEQNEAKIDSKIDLVNRAMKATLARSPNELDDSMSEVEDQLASLDDEPNVFLDQDVQGQIAMHNQRNVEDSQSEPTESDEDEDPDDSIKDVEHRASDISGEWIPSGEESSASSLSLPPRMQPGRRSSCKPRAKSNAAAVRGKLATDAASTDYAGKENERPKANPDLRRSETVSVHVKEEPCNGVVLVHVPVEKTSSKSRPVPKPTTRARGWKKSVDEVKLEEIEATMIIPNKAARKAAVAAAGEGAVYVPGEGEVDASKKKKRKMLGKAAVVTEEQMLEMAREKGSESQRSPSKLKRTLRG